jgi:hypothetical protein
VCGLNEQKITGRKRFQDSTMGSIDWVAISKAGQEVPRSC